jgi:hypothetical protein
MSCSDAPRSGREVLIATLAERFPKVASVRQSTARARAAPAVAPVAAAPKRTLPDRTGGPVATAAPTKPGLETVMSAPTATMDVRPQARPRPPRHPRLLLLVIVVALASALLAFAVVSASRAAGLPAPAEHPSQNKSSSQVRPVGPSPPDDSHRRIPMTIIHGTR